MKQVRQKPPPGSGLVPTRLECGRGWSPTWTPSWGRRWSTPRGPTYTPSTCRASPPPTRDCTDVTAKQFSDTIVRYFILSWTICLSRMSVRLNEEFKDELALNKKRLMLKREFDILSCGTGRDSWREKWSTPLAWVAKMVNDANYSTDQLQVLVFSWIVLFCGHWTYNM